MRLVNNFVQNFASMEDTVFCGVFDGHGPFGHLVARQVRDSVPSKLLHYWEERMVHRAEDKLGTGTPNQRENSTNVERNGTVEKPFVHQNGGFVHRENGAEGKMSYADTVHEAEDHPVFETWKESHLTAYRVMDKELRTHPGIDCFCSGTTAVTVLKQVGIKLPALVDQVDHCGLQMFHVFICRSKLHFEYKTALGFS